MSQDGERRRGMRIVVFNVIIVSLSPEGVKPIVPPLLDTAAGDSLSIDEATSDYYSLQPTPNHSRHSSSVTELSTPPPLSPSPSFFFWSFPLYSSRLYTSWLHPPQVLLSVGEEVWSRLGTRWKRYVHVHVHVPSVNIVNNQCNYGLVIDLIRKC